jgi:trigger factor
MKNENKPDEEPKRNVAEIGKNLPDFDKGVLGMHLDEEKIIEVSYPEDYHEEELKGSTVPVRAKVIEINEKHLPELNDEWVKAIFVGEQEEDAESNPDAVDTTDKLHAKIREALEKSAHDIAEEDVRNKIIQQVVANSKVSIPEVMIHEAVEERFERLQEDIKKNKATLDDYLKYMDQSFEELYKVYAEESKRVLETMLVFREIMEKENIKVEDEDVEAEISAMATQQGVPVETIKAYMDSTDGGDIIINRVLRKKIVDFLVHASNIINIEGQNLKVKKSKSQKVR